MAGNPTRRGTFRKREQGFLKNACRRFWNRCEPRIDKGHRLARGDEFFHDLVEEGGMVEVVPNLPSFRLG